MDIAVVKDVEEESLSSESGSLKENSGENCDQPNVDDEDSNEGETNEIKLTADMIAEEEELEKERQDEEEKDALQNLEEKQNEEETEKRLKRLAVLLNQSEFFSNFIARRIEEKNEELKAKSAKSGRKKTKDLDDQLLKDKALLDSRHSDSLSNKDPKKEEVLSITKVTSMGIEVDSRQPMLLEGACMRDYQIYGFEWMKLLFINGVNGILADEMGLGKTIQTIALLAFMIENKMSGPYLIVAPLSTLANWVNEFNAFCPRVPVILYHGSQSNRQILSKKISEVHTVSCGKYDVKTLPVVVTSYEVAMRDRDALMRRDWDVVAVDEGHRIKNHQCRLGRELRKYNSKFRLLLTGTPLQNDLRELWSLLNYLIPDVFADLSAFESWFEVKDLSNETGNFEQANRRIVEQEKKNQIISKLHKILQPFMLRRMKSDVDLKLPPKKELLVFTPMTPEQEELYKHILQRTIHEKLAKEKEKKEQKEMIEKEILKGGPIAKRLRKSCNSVDYNIDKISDKEFESRYNANLEYHSYIKTDTQSSYMKSCVEQGVVTSLNPCSIVIDLRKVVNHPYLIQMPLIPGTMEPLINENLVKRSGKMLVLDAMLAKLKKTGHKVLIFSQWKSVLDLIEEFMMLRMYNYCRLDGSTKIADRVESISQFNKDPKIFAFLLSTRAGGLGINLTAADTVIIYDSDWNPQCDLQAQDRCHRIGQTKPVVVYRLTTDGTIDRRMVERATGKRRLEKLIIKQGHFVGEQKSLKKLGTSGELSPEELLKLLNSKDYTREVQSNGYIYTDKELDQLLDRSDMLGNQSSTIPERMSLKRKHSDSNQKELFQEL
ncbi:lymphoid-specific helicase-like [Neocloeon triangulifer]|uniref:lymphoid-specific helicase-like n=1 Tax=Neocloeon triangulifer TaxID=2078957 RepID=UPI00286F124A|nr:lymphoid-specific helicase-like [Neocloeon triangulifer]